MELNRLCIYIIERNFLNISVICIKYLFINIYIYKNNYEILLVIYWVLIYLDRIF